MIDEFEHKYLLFLQYSQDWGEEETKRRLGLPDWQYDHYTKRKNPTAEGYRLTKGAGQQRS